MNALKQALKFGIVGGLATLVHIMIGVTLIHSGWPALLANVVAFLIAFLVSFSGHYGYSFAGQEMRLSASLTRFLIVAILGFCLNTLLLLSLITLSDIAHTWALALSAGTVALISFLLSKLWAFNVPQRS